MEVVILLVNLFECVDLVGLANLCVRGERFTRNYLEVFTRLILSPSTWLTFMKAPPPKCSLGFNNITIIASLSPSQSCHVGLQMEQPPPQHNWPSCKKRQWQLFIATRSPQPGCLWHPHPHCIVDLHASKDHPGEQLVINAWHCVGHGEELVRGLSSRAVSFCNSSRVSNWK